MKRTKALLAGFILIGSLAAPLGAQTTDEAARTPGTYNETRDDGPNLGWLGLLGLAGLLGLRRRHPETYGEARTVHAR